MEKLFGQYDPKVARYAEETFKPEDEVLREIRERSDRLRVPSIQVGKMDGLHLEVLTRAMNAKKAVEIGTLSGYSGVCILRGLQPGGMLYTFEYEPKHAEIARESFRNAGFEGQAKIFIGKALENLPKIQNEGPFDLVFIDADKMNYPNYFEWAAQNLRPGGCILADNTFAWGMIADSQFPNRDAEIAATGLQKFNAKVATDQRFRATILPTAEGLTVAVKLP